MPKTTRYTFVIARKPIEDRPMVLSGFLDMLRYDAATLIDSTHNAIVLQTVGHEPAAGRWQSFGLYILAQTEGDYPDTIALLGQAAPRLP